MALIQETPYHVTDLPKIEDHIRTPRGSTGSPSSACEQRLLVPASPLQCINKDAGALVTPSALQEYRVYHELQAPSCLCALINDIPYIETRVGLVESGEHQGASSAEPPPEKICATKSDLQVPGWNQAMLERSS
ncbi:hypothetical protein BKA70DRAFT_1220475 [Coprinopsis sp. MPI-PUGE-AT-0042]|nr:hypothetical protein BKA70DRAFT_1220475 [Coprinopsis sp. MPI-PUGE-AT-0042]